MPRPKKEGGPKRVQPHLWSVSWGEWLDSYIEKLNKENKINGQGDSKGQVAKYLTTQGIHYLEAAKLDPSVRDRVEELYRQFLAQEAPQAEAPAQAAPSVEEVALPSRPASGKPKKGSRIA